MNSVLIVVAHPDDEVLGCGATAAALATQGTPVRVCMMSGKAGSRQHHPGDAELLHDTKRAQRILELEEPILYDFPNIRFNTVPHLNLVQSIEAAIRQTKANVIFTHHPADVNDDHAQTSRACQAAVRLFQREPGRTPLQALHFMEILSATDWSLPAGGGGFQPTTFFEIGEAGVELKLKALRAYRGVMRDFPHPRSNEIVRALAAYRGGQAGMRYAEGFQTAFHRLGSSEQNG